MSKPPDITTEQHRDQISKYSTEYPSYELFASVLKRVLGRACAVSFPDAMVQARAKSISSFAAKCARKFDKYPDAAHQMTDLCGGRVIVQTMEQVRAVRQFIEANFEIIETDDKGLLLSEDRFGYRDMHYLIRLRRDRCPTLGVTEGEIESIGSRCAEIQVRTWMQHAWADTFHDRMYKNPLPLPPDMRRTGALLAALMEEGDRTFGQMVERLDGMIANYTASATREKIDHQVNMHRLLLDNEPDKSRKPALALSLARLLAVKGDFGGVVEILDPFRGVRDANRYELLQDLGHALCRANQGSLPGSTSEYERGVELLENALTLFTHPDGESVVHLRKRASLHARVLWRLGCALDLVPGQEHRARDLVREAYECEPENPYYLTEMLGMEIHYTRHSGLPAAMRSVISRAIDTCLSHARAKIEVPMAYFTAGRLHLLLENAHDAVFCYARGALHLLDDAHYANVDVLQCERRWLQRLHIGAAQPDLHKWINQLFDLAGQLATGKLGSGRGNDKVKRVLVVVGGAASMDAGQVNRVRPLVKAALEAFPGEKVISGGTEVGIPGCVGEVSDAMAQLGTKRFELVGYLPRLLPGDAPQDRRYDTRVTSGESGFSPGQVLHSWADLLHKDGVHPADVTILGFGGGPISATEYRLALALGATVAVVCNTGGTAQDLLADELWCHLPNLLPIPHDPASIRALVAPASRTYSAAELDSMAEAFHKNYVSTSASRLPDNMKPWSDLADTYREANRQQASYAVEILEAVGFEVRESQTPVIYCFSAADEPLVEAMAELEHGRWNVERLRNGWRYGKRDNSKKLHDSIVPWPELPEEIKDYDRQSVRNFPEILATAGLEVHKP